MSLEIFSISSLINGIVALGFGVLIIFKNWRSRVNQLFFLMVMTLAVWAFGYWVWISSAESGTALLWVRIFSIGSLFIPVFYFHWIISLLDLNKQKRLAIAAAYAIAFIFLGFSFSEFFIRGVREKLFFPFWPDAGILYAFYILFLYFGLILYALRLLFRQYRISSGLVRGQILYIIFGTLFGFGGGATNFFLWYDIPIAPYGNFFVALFPFFLGYAVIQYRLFDLRIVATELLIFAVWIFLFIRIVLGESLREQIADGGLLLLFILFGILLIRSILHEIKQREKMRAITLELTAANEKLYKLDRAKSEFISIASHQLRAPLTVIRGYISMALEGTFGSIKNTLKDALEKIRFSTDQLTKLVSDLLDLSRIESGKIEYAFALADFINLVSKTVDEIRPAAEKKKVEIALEHGGEKTLRFNFDADKMREVVFNLIDNAVKYSPGGGLVKVSIEPFERMRKRWIRFLVKDTGMGIKKDDFPKLFVKFSRTEEAHRINPNGMGIGLYFVKHVVDNHQGTVRVESEGTGKGSTFIVELPLNER